MAAAVADADAGQQPPVGGMAAPGQQEQPEPQQNEAGLVQGTLASPRLPRQLSIRSKLLYTAIQEVRGVGEGRASVVIRVFGCIYIWKRCGGRLRWCGQHASFSVDETGFGSRAFALGDRRRGRGRVQWAALCERAAAIVCFTSASP